MLRSLKIKNFAVIEEIELEFGPGLNALTGETGAGKSILLEALGFLLGGRGSSSWLRSGSSKLEVEGIFDAADLPEAMRREFGASGPAVCARRELDASGKTKAFLGSRPIPASTLAAWGEGLVDFQGQHEHQALLKPAVQLACLDQAGSLSDDLKAAAAAYERWSALESRRQGARLSEEERRRLIDLRSFEVEDISRASLRQGEEAELETQLPLVKNAERIQSLAGSAYEALYEQEGSALAGLMKTERCLAELARVDASMTQALESLEGARLALSELADTLARYKDRTEAGPGKLDEMMNRLEDIARLKKKYGGSESSVFAYLEKAQEELKSLEGSPEEQEKLERDLAAAEMVLAAASETLHDRRIKAARKLEKAVAKELSELGLGQARLSVAVDMEEGRWGRSGADAVEFLISANPGEPLRPLRSVASGGELSRVMLALKTALAKADRPSILVFDEVDAGVGGQVGRAVGEKLARVSQRSQALCVTHLPQVACFAARHIHVSKKISAGRTRVEAAALEGTARIEALASMLGGREASAVGLKAARELLESAA